MKKKVALVALALLAIVSYILYFGKVYERNYFEKLGIYDLGFNYEEMIKVFGNPKETYWTENGFYDAKYDDLIFSYFGDSPEAIVICITVLDEKYKFGWRKIGVGSSKKEVLRAYRRVKRSPDEGYAFVDGLMWVEFFFDENDRVKEIMIAIYS